MYLENKNNIDVGGCLFLMLFIFHVEELLVSKPQTRLIQETLCWWAVHSA